MMVDHKNTINKFLLPVILTESKNVLIVFFPIILFYDLFLIFVLQ